MNMIAAATRNIIIKKIKKHLDIISFEVLEVEIKNGKVRYNVNGEGWKAREVDENENDEIVDQLGFGVSNLELKITKNEITGTLIDDGGKETKFNY